MAGPLAAVTDPADAVVRLLQTVETDKEGLVAVVDRLEDLLVETDLLYKLTIAPRSVGVDPSNRDGEGINPLNVLSLASEIADVGFSYTEIGDKPICCEVPPGDLAVEAFNVKLSADSGMADVPKDSIHYGSLSCSHTNYVLRCVAGGVPCEDELLAEGGRMSVAKIGRRDNKNRGRCGHGPPLEGHPLAGPLPVPGGHPAHPAGQERGGDDGSARD